MATEKASTSPTPTAVDPEGADEATGSAEVKAMTLRLATAQYERLQAVASVEGTSVTQAVRQAIDELVDRRRRDPEFRRLLQENVERQRRLLELLDDSEEEAP